MVEALARDMVYRQVLAQACLLALERALALDKALELDMELDVELALVLFFQRDMAQGEALAPRPDILNNLLLNEGLILKVFYCFISLPVW